jgi:ring-1,2-phenylacetyl-CoA epoxidase subunit PaaD
VSAIHAAVATVTDPEYPDVSIADLGLVEYVRTDGGAVRVGLVPTFAGCPALAMIAADVEAAVGAVAGVSSCAVEWLSEPVWTPDRANDRARGIMAEDYTVVFDDRGALHCPVCGGTDVDLVSAVGSTRCRAVHRCRSCLNPVEVVQSVPLARPGS